MLVYALALAFAFALALAVALAEMDPRAAHTRHAAVAAAVTAVLGGLIVSFNDGGWVGKGRRGKDCFGVRFPMEG